MVLPATDPTGHHQLGPRLGTLILVASLLVAACKAERNQPCDGTDACASSLRCVDDRCRDEAFVAKMDACSRDPLCASDGRCSADYLNGELACAATADADCATSSTCAEHGDCAAQRGFCYPGTDEHCSRSADCARSGRCAVADDPKKGRICAPTEEKHCSESYYCKAKRFCALAESRECELVRERPCTDASASAPAGWSDDEPIVLGRVDDTPSKPGNIEGATLHCIAASTSTDGSGATTARVEVGDRCRTLPGPVLTMTGLTLEKGETIRINMHQKRFGSPKHVGYVEWTYDGTSPLRANDANLQAACHALTRAEAEKMAEQPLEDARTALGEVRAARPVRRRFLPSLMNPVQPTPKQLANRRFRAALRGAAAWLGWKHPAITKLLDEHDRVP